MMKNRTYTELFDFLENTHDILSYKGSFTDEEISKLKEIKNFPDKPNGKSYSSEEVRAWCQKQDSIIRDEKLKKIGI